MVVFVWSWVSLPSPVLWGHGGAAAYLHTHGTKVAPPKEKTGDEKVSRGPPQNGQDLVWWYWHLFRYLDVCPATAPLG